MGRYKNCQSTWTGDWPSVRFERNVLRQGSVKLRDARASTSRGRSKAFQEENTQRAQTERATGTAAGRTEANCKDSLQD